MPDGGEKLRAETDPEGRVSQRPLIRVLGEVALQVGPEVAAIPGRLLRRVLLRLLLADGRSVSASALSEDVWGDIVPSETIRVQLSRLRRVLTPLDVTIVATGGGWTLSCDAEQVDSHVFAKYVQRALTSIDPELVIDACESAMSLVRGRMLDDVADEHWASVKSRNLEAEKSSLLQRWAETLLLTNRVETGVPILRQLLAERPYDEQAAAWLSVGIASTGERAGGLAVLNNFRRILYDELGIRPGKLFVDAESALLDDCSTPLQFAPPSHQLDLRAISTPTTRIIPDPLIDSTFVGRERELAALTDRRLSVATSLICGEAGIGKSALARHIAFRSESHQQSILYGKCTEQSGIAFEPLVEAVAAERDAKMRTLGVEFLRGAPWNYETVLGTEHEESTVPEYVGYQFAQFVCELRKTRSLVVIIEDLHWASDSTLQALCGLTLEMIRELDRDRKSPGPNEPVHLLFTSRHVRHPGKFFERLTDSIGRCDGSVHLDLEALDSTDVAQLLEIRGVQASPETIALVCEQTSGNPLFVGELARELASRNEPSGRSAIDLGVFVPAKIESITQSRLRKLSVGAREILFNVACAGGQLGHRFLRCAVSDQDEAGYFAAIDECMSADILTDDVRSDAVVFKHHYFERIAVGMIGPGRRQKIHAALAHAMKDEPQNIEEAALHFAESGRFVQRADVIGSGLAAIDFSVKAGAFDNAKRHLERCWRFVKPDDQEWARVNLAAAVVAGSSADIGSAKRYATEAIRRAISDEDDATAFAALSIHCSYGTNGDADPETIALFAGLERMPLPSTGFARMIPILRCEHEAMWRGDAQANRPRAEVAFSELEIDPNPALLGAASYALSMAMLADNNLALRSRRIELLEQSSVLSGRAADRGRAIRLRGFCAIQSGDRVELERLIAEAEEYSRVPGVWYLGTDASRWKAALAMADGQWTQAETFIGENDRRSFGVHIYLETGTAQRALLAYRLGLLRGDEASLLSLRSNRVVRASVEGLIGMCALDHGRRDVALEQLRVVLELSYAEFHHRNHLSDLAFLGSLIDGLEECDVAEKVVERFEPYASQMAMTGAGEFVIGSIDRYRASLASLVGEHDRAEALFADALHLESGWPVPQLETQLSQSRARLRASDFSMAAEIAAQGKGLANDLQLRPLATAFHEVFECAQARSRRV
jgi:DNA-binding SARP family transcriptional activator